MLTMQLTFGNIFANRQCYQKKASAEAGFKLLYFPLHDCTVGRIFFFDRLDQVFALDA